MIDPTFKMRSRNHVPMLIWSPTVVVCTFGGEPIRDNDVVFIYKEGREAPDRCKGWELKDTLIKFYSDNENNKRT